VARVNGTPIRAEDLVRLVAALEGDKRSPLTDADRTHLLDRLVEEELLVQRAVEIGLVDSEPGVRKALVQALVDAVVAEAESEEPDEDTLRRFYAERPEYFVGSERLRVERLVFRPREPGAAPRERAEEARTALAAGEPLAAVRERLGDTPILPLPAASLPAAKLREYLGHEAVARLLAAPAGAWTEPLESAEGVQILRLAERSASAPPPYEAVAREVSAEWHRQQGDRALREFLDFLRSAADVVVKSDP
jgi:hypothetical protein